MLGFSDCLALLCLMARSFGLLLLPLMARTLGHHGMPGPMGPFSLACSFVNLLLLSLPCGLVEVGSLTFYLCSHWGIVDAWRCSV